MAPKSNKSSGPRAVATNRQARRDYEILDTYEAGIALQGSEVKSLRRGQGAAGRELTPASTTARSG